MRVDKNDGMIATVTLAIDEVAALHDMVTIFTLQNGPNLGGHPNVDTEYMRGVLAGMLPKNKPSLSFDTASIAAEFESQIDGWLAGKIDDFPGDEGMNDMSRADAKDMYQVAAMIRSGTMEDIKRTTRKMDTLPREHAHQLLEDVDCNFYASVFLV